MLTVATLVSLSSFSIRDNAMQRTQHEVDQLATTFVRGIGLWMCNRQKAVNSLKGSLQRSPEVNILPFMMQVLMQIHEASGFALTYDGDERGNMYRQDPSLNTAGYDPRVRLWYQDAMREGTMIMAAPCVSATLQKLVVTIAEPVMNNGRLQGVAAANLSIDQLTDAARTLKMP